MSFLLSPHFHIFGVQEYSGLVSLTSHYLLSALPLTASTGFAEILLVIDAVETPAGCYCIKKCRGILTLSIAVLTSVPGSVFLYHLKDGLSRYSWFAKWGRKCLKNRHLWNTEWTNQPTYSLIEPEN